MSLFGGDVFASLDNLPYLAYRQGSSVDDSDTISSASSEDYDEGDDNDEYNVSCEEDDKGLEDDHEEESTKPWLSLLRGYFAMVSSSFDTKRIQSIDAGKDATSLVSRLVTELDRILHPDFFATFLRDTLL